MPHNDSIKGKNSLFCAYTVQTDWVRKHLNSIKSTKLCMLINTVYVFRAYERCERDRDPRENKTSLSHLFLISVILFPIPDFANEKLHPSLSDLVRTISEYRVVLLKWPLGEYFKNTGRILKWCKRLLHTETEEKNAPSAEGRRELL